MKRPFHLPSPNNGRQKPDFSLATVNIVFLLLLFFIAAGTLVSEQETIVDLPDTETLPLEQLPRPLLVVTDEGSLFLNGEPLTSGQEYETIDTYFKSASTLKKTIHIMANHDLPAVALVKVLSQLNRLGIQPKIVTRQTLKQANE